MTENWHQSVKNKNREDLIAAGKQLFLEKGFLAANVKDICESAGISRVTFYKHFESLDHLIFEIQMELLDNMTQHIAHTAGHYFTGKQELMAMLNTWVNFALGHTDHIRFILIFDLHYETFTAAPDLKKNYDAFIEAGKQKHFLLGTLESGIKDGSLKPDLDPLETAQFIFTSMMGVLQSLSVNYTEHKVQEVAGIAERFIGMLMDHVSCGNGK